MYKYKNQIFNLIKFIGSAFLRIILHIFWIFPIKENRILFTSYVGEGITCNPKYIYEYLLNNYGKQFDCIWVLNSSNGDSIHSVKMNTLGYCYYAITAKFYICNTGVTSYLPKRKGQIFINTWHGGGAYKKAGIDYNASKLDKLKQKKIAEETDYVLSSSKVFSNIMSKSLLIDKSRFLESGMPRNDVFFKSNNSNYINKIKTNLGFVEQDKIILYAPTYRERRSSFLDLDTVGLHECLKKRFGGKWTGLIRAHHFEKRRLSEKEWIDVSEYPDMQELLLIADVLITDYSSCMWDFSLTFKPGFIFAPDIEDYMYDRNFYTALDEWPYPVAASNQALQSNILNFDYQVSKEKIKKHHLNLGNFENGTAGKQVCDLIISKKNTQ